VTTDVPGCRDVVTDGDNGLLVPAKSSEQLAKALDRLVGDQALRARFGARSRSRAVEEFSLAKVVTEQLALYTRILGI
jgi:glycosyltransferase involved in cell wall biosynthesis